MEFLEKLVGSTPEQVNELVSTRLTELNKTKHIGREIESIETQFIPSTLDIRIKDSNSISLYDTYCLEGIDYLDYCNYLKKNIDINSKKYIIDILMETFNYVNNYFKMDIYNNEKDIRENIIEYYYKKNNKDPLYDDYTPPISIFKGTGAARCLEYAALLQNLFSFIGIDITLFNTVQKTGDDICGHSFNIINVNDMHIFVDLVNLNILENKKTSFVVKRVTNEEYENLINGNIFEIERIDTTKESGKKLSKYLLLNAHRKGKNFPTSKQI